MSHHTHSTDRSVSLIDAPREQQAMRDAAGMPPDRFAVPEFVSMLSDEIDACRARGHDDAGVAAVIHEAIGFEISAEEVQRHWTPEDQRQRG